MSELATQTLEFAATHQSLMQHLVMTKIFALNWIFASLEFALDMTL